MSAVFMQTYPIFLTQWWLWGRYLLVNEKVDFGGDATIPLPD